MIKGYFLTVGKKAIFYVTDADRKSKAVVNGMIEAAGNYKGLCPDWIERIKADTASFKRIQHEMQAATLEKMTTTSGYQYYKIMGRYFGGGYDLDEIIIA